MNPAASDELAYFARFLPRLGAVTEPTIDYDQLGERYFGRTASDLAALRADADVVGVAVGTMRAQCDAQQQLILGLAAGWEGAAADSALAALVADLDRARASTEAMAGVHAALLAAAEVIATVVAANATLMGELDATQIGGRTAAEVDLMIAVARLEPGDHAWGLLRQASGLFAELTPMIPSVMRSGALVGDRLLDVAVDLASTWLREVFVPQVHAQLAGVLELCDATARAVDGAHRLVSDAMELAGSDPDGFGAVHRVADPVAGFTPAAPAQSPVAQVAAAEPTVTMVVVETAGGQTLRLVREDGEPRIYRVEIGADGEPYLCECDSRTNESAPLAEPSEPPAFPDLAADQAARPVPESPVLEPPAPGPLAPEPPVPALPTAPTPRQARDGGSKAPAASVDESPTGPAPESGAELAEAGPL
ncbi:hypothetical protein FCG67_03360 [Rhodococcus oryzae]|uniref:WXG100 family type VII secretion target n=1 Tax=Rhodococcus oryzae TaxID=2571143 RepID=A0ABY2RSG0_9NOCA|nr:hypothetical protein [Rhodococcus oryzae]TJZ81663.1 hypothetical protein FCG67_03360 [Rhodococcus oryzae]